MKTFLLILGDILVFYFALFIALSIRVQEIAPFDFFAKHIMPFALLAIIWLFVSYIAGLYDSPQRRNAQNLFTALMTAVSIFFVISIILLYFLPTVFGLTPKITLTLFVLTFFILFFFWRLYIPRILQFAQPKALLIGGPHKPTGFEITTIVPPNSSKEIILGAIQGMSNGRVLMSFRHPALQTLLPQLYTLMLSGIIFIDADTLFEDESGKVDLKHIDEKWLLQYTQRRDNQLFLLGKRVIDITMALLLMPLYFAFLPFVWLAIKLEDGGKVFIAQERYGRNREVFKLYKFRTMTVDDDGYWHKGDKNVITKVGRFLRKSRIDELPQLWNVLKGDISLIGPRPDMVKFGEALAGKIDYYNARYIVRPGLTGWAQVTQAVIPQSIEESRERLAYDLYYIKHLSIFLELKIILKTVKLLLNKIFAKRGYD